MRPRIPWLAVGCCLVLVSGSVQAQQRTEPVPVGGVSQDVAVLGPLEGGIRPVPPRNFDLDELNDDLGSTDVDGLVLTPAIEAVLDTRSPSPTSPPWTAAANSSCAMIDPQVAASDTIVAVLTWDTLSFYDKSGTLLPSTPSFTNPTNTETLFEPIVAALDANLNLNPDVASDSSFQFANGQVGDARIAFDPQRHRFVILGTAKNNAKHPSDVTHPEYGISQRRTKFLFAISKTEDPANGFWLYAANATPNDGACNSESDAAPCPGSDFTPGDAGDYPSLGISTSHYVFTDHVNHISVSNGANNAKTAYIVSFNAAAAAAGSSLVHGHGFWFFDNPKLGVFDSPGPALGVIMPAIQRTKLPGGDGNLLVGTVLPNRISVYTVGPTDPPSLSGVAFQLGHNFTNPRRAPQPAPGLPLNYDQLGATPITAYWRKNVLYSAFADCIRFADMGPGQCSDAVHIVRLAAVATFQAAPDELIFGERNPLDEPPGTVNDYAFPGLAVNKHGDLAVTYNRSGPTLPPEVRYSVWYHGEAAQRPSTVLQAGTGDQAWGFDGQGNEQGYRDDTAGVAVDPFDDTAIWMAHTYAAGGPVGCNSQQVAVGKVFGSTRPDLVVSGVAFLPEVVRAGGALRVSFVASDRGDGAAGPSRAQVSLVGIQRGPSPVLGTVDVAALRPGESRTLEAGFDVPSNLPPGSYRVRVTIRLDESAREYSRTNNAAESSSLLPVT